MMRTMAGFGQHSRSTLGDASLRRGQARDDNQKDDASAES